MHCTSLIKSLRTQVLSLAALSLTAGPSLAVDLVAIEGQWSPDGGTTQIPMWGFVEDTGQACNTLPDWTVGPQLSDADLEGGNLTINLRNCLPEAASIIIPGQPATFTPQTTVDGQGRTRVTAFTSEAAAGGTASYTWTGVKPGTYLYQSGSHPAKQVQMGLYGALIVGTYPETSGEVTLLYSEIDPLLHNPPAAATPLGYKPRYYLVNSSMDQVSLGTAEGVGTTSQPTVLRILNAGLDFHVPTLSSGHMLLIAEDGNAYPFAKQEYSATLAAGKTIDALWQPVTAGEYLIYDRRGNNMVASLNVGAGTNPVAVNDAYSTDEDVELVLEAPGVLDNDIPAGTLTAVLVDGPSAGTLNSTLAIDGSFTYTPNPDFSGTDSFTYLANDGTNDSNVATVGITVTGVNDPPAAVIDAYNAELGKTLFMAAPGVLGNDTDPDGDALTAQLGIGPTAGTLVLNLDGSFQYDPADGAEGEIVTFTYFALDGTTMSDAANVTITIIGATNVAPVAEPDTATVVRNSASAFINLIGNDSDADGNLKDDAGNVAASQITITTGASTTRGGTVTVVTNGVNYTPKRNFRGTDTFNYYVTDQDGADSDEVTVRVNVVRP